MRGQHGYISECRGVSGEHLCFDWAGMGIGLDTDVEQLEVEGMVGNC